MNGYRAELLTIARTGSGHGELAPGVLAGIGRRRAAPYAYEERISHGDRDDRHGERAPRGDRTAPGGERGEASDSALRCVSSGYLSDGCSCRARVPAAVASAAWRDELERGTSVRRLLPLRLARRRVARVWAGDGARARRLLPGASLRARAEARIRSGACPRDLKQKQRRRSRARRSTRRDSRASPSARRSTASSEVGRGAGSARAPTASTARPRASACSRSTRRRRRSAARCTSATSSPIPTPTRSPATRGCAAKRSSTRWAGTTTACRRSAACRTTTGCAATRRSPTTRGLPLKGHRR